MQLKLHAESENFLTLKKKRENSVNLSRHFLFQSRYASSASTAAIFRQSAGCVFEFYAGRAFN